MSSSKLPRRPHADRPRPNEKIVRQGGADLQNGWLGRHGTLSLTGERLVFVPTPLDMFLRAKRREIAYDEILRLEREPRDVNGTNPGARRNRMIIWTEECGYQFMVGDLDSWIDMIEIVVNKHRSEHHRDPLVVERENYTNPLVASGLLT